MAKSQIIKELANSTIDIHTALKRTKLLLQDLGNDEILRWVTYELEGYPSGAEIPYYRKVKGQLYGTYLRGSMINPIKYTNVSLPLGKMPEKEQVSLLCADITQSISSLKEMLIANKDIAIQIPADYFPIIIKYNNDPYMHIVSAEVKLNMPTIKDISPKVESKLLDILIYLETQFEKLDELDIDTSSKNETEMQNITNHIYYTIYSDNSLTMGNDNKIKDSTIATAAKTV